MHPLRLARFVRKWFAEWKPARPVYGHASALLTQLIEARPDEAWERILALIAHAPDQEAMGCVGAGPLEDLLSLHGQIIIDRVEAAAATDSRFAACLAVVWGENRMEPSIYDRVHRAVQSTPKATRNLST